MAKVLVLDPSATLLHVIGKLLRTHGYDVLATETYEEGADLVRRHHGGDPEARLSALVLGWPAQPTPLSAGFVLELEQSQNAHIPILVMAIEAWQKAVDWTSSRANSALLLLDEHAHVGEALDKLIGTPELVRVPVESGPRRRRPDRDIRILFVDDSKSVRIMMGRLLQREGYKVETAASADAGWVTANQKEFDIAIIDYFMPGGNGDGLIRKLRHNPRTAHIMTAIFTGTYLDHVIKDSLDAGASDCMFKSEASELFLARVGAMSRTIRTRRSVEKETRRLEGILRSVGEGVYGVDTNARLTFMNPAAKSILGYPDSHDLTNQSPHALFHYAHGDGTPNSPDTCFLQQAYELGDQLHAWETTFWDAEEKAVAVECTVYPLRIEGHLQGSVVAFRDISSRQLMEQELKWQANHDHLTKLFNRHTFDQELRHEVMRLRGNRREMSALLYIDLDRFKYINDTAGHSAGDQLLITVSNSLQMRLREGDLLARLGGDEFGIIVRDIRRHDVPEIAEEFRKMLQTCSFSYNGKTYKINGSIGVSLLNTETPTPDDALANADIACHIAKQQGRNQVHIYDPGNDDKLVMDVELGWSARLNEALENDLFLLHFQPVFDLREMDFVASSAGFQDSSMLPVPVHYEVLVRLPGRNGKLILPNAFLPTAERFNLMPQIDLWVIRNAIKRLRELEDTGQAVPVILAINLSGNSLNEAGTRAEICSIIEHSGIDPSRFIFEITETSAIENVDVARQFIREIRTFGSRFALDDFGCGFSSFSHLKQLDVDYVKIDGSFVQEMTESPVDQAMIRSINDIAQVLGKQTIAEFVETAEQLVLLKEYGVDFVQGHGLGMPGAYMGDSELSLDAAQDPDRPDMQDSGKVIPIFAVPPLHPASGD